MERIDGRKNDELRPIKVTPDYIIHPNGSVLIESGNTKVICTATVEEKVPPFMKGQGKGWITAEYSMLPGSTETRKIRASSKGKIDGRSQEIQRLIGRSLRSVVDFKKLGERTIWIDCDVIQADGGTRTASITGAFIAMSIAVKRLMEEKILSENPIKYHLAATSVGIFEDEVVLDLCYHEDSSAKVDMNIIMTEKGEFVEIQGTGEDCPFSREELMKMLEYGEKGVLELIYIQKNIVDINSL